MDITSKRFSAFVHIIFWATYLLVNGASYSRFVGLPEVYIKILLSGGVHLGFVLINLLILLPRLFLKRKFALYIAIMIPLYTGAVLLLLIIENNWSISEGEATQLFTWSKFVTAFISTFIVLSMTALLRFLQEWFIQVQRNRELAISQLTAEHKMLRMQVNPHFLFNTLNNIYSLVYKQSDAAAPAILKLAQLMRYLLYDSDTKKVPLQTEVDYIKNYIGLQQLKYTNEDKVTLTTKNINTTPIDPLLFIPFVENAFKHSNLDDDDAFLNISIILEGNQLEFKLTNTFDKNDLVKDEVGGIGIENVKSRLLLYYPNRHHLQIDEHQQTYSILLQIQLS